MAGSPGSGGDGGGDDDGGRDEVDDSSLSLGVSATFMGKGGSMASVVDGGDENSGGGKGDSETDSGVVPGGDEGDSEGGDEVTG